MSDLPQRGHEEQHGEEGVASESVSVELRSSSSFRLSLQRKSKGIDRCAWTEEPLAPSSTRRPKATSQGQTQNNIGDLPCCDVRSPPSALERSIQRPFGRFLHGPVHGNCSIHGCVVDDSIPIPRTGGPWVGHGQRMNQLFSSCIVDLLAWR